MDANDWVNIGVGVAQLVLAAVILRRLRGFWRPFPWLPALMAYFGVRGADRIYAGLDTSGDRAFGLGTDFVLLVVLVLLIAGIDRTVRGLRLAAETADARSAEYERALSDYRTLARHRLANPLSVIRGGIATLRARELEPAAREAILAGMAAETERLERVALDPEPEREEERSLRPRPEV